MAWRGFEHDQVLRGADVPEELVRNHGEVGTRRRGHLAIAVMGLDQAELAHVAGERDLCRLDTVAFLEFASQVVLRENLAASDELQDLALAKTLVHCANS